MPLNKGQVLTLTIFMLLTLLATNVILLLPIQQQLIKTRKLLFSFQALTSAETGLEIGNYKILKEGITQKQSLSYSGSLCAQKINKYQNFIQGWNIGNTCDFVKINASNYTIEIYSTEMKKGFIYSSFLSNISTGKYNGIERVLDFDFLP